MPLNKETKTEPIFLKLSDSPPQWEIKELRSNIPLKLERNPSEVETNMLDCKIVLNKFVLHSS